MAVHRKTLTNRTVAALTRCAALPRARVCAM